MKETNTYKYMFRKRILIVFSIVLLAVVEILPATAVTVDAASSLLIRYHQKNRTYTGTRLSATVDGTSVNMNSTPGLALKNAKGDTIYMVSAYDVFKTGCGISYSYKNGKLVLKKYGITVRMYLNSKTAYVNGKKTALDYPVTMIKFRSVNKTKLFVPAKFVATTFGYTYTYDRTSSTNVTLKMTSAYYLKYNSKWTKYTQTKAKLTFDGNGINVSDLYCVVINNCFYVQAKAFANSTIGGTYGFQNSSKKVTIGYGGKKLVMYAGSKTAYLDGNEVAMSKPATLVYNSKNDTTFVMVPISYVCTKLGFRYAYSESAKTCRITRKDTTYFDWDTDDTDSSYYVSGVTGKRESDTDIVALSGYFPTDNITVSESGNKISVTILGSVNKIGANSLTVEQPYLLKSVKLSTNASGETVLTIGKKNFSVNYSFRQEDGYVAVTLSTEAVKNGYKIAVDCGHGAYTAGKRTPPILASLDFNSDGIIDAVKGTQIREHTANVGVGNYVVEALERCGFEVYKSGFGSTDTPLSTRQANIKASGSDYSISIHFNATGSGTSFNSANGIEVFSHSNSSKAKNSYSLAKAVLSQVVNGTKQKNRGVNTAHTFAMCNASAMGTKGSILLECAFMTNWTEVKTMMANEGYWEETGEEVAKAFCQYTGVTYVEPK